MMKKMYVSLIAVSILLLGSVKMNAQNTFPPTGSAGIGTTTPNASSILDMVSTSKGLLVPRMTKAQRDAIASPATGLLIYQTNSSPGFYFWSGAAWTAVKTAGGANKSLSNLAMTAVNDNILPSGDKLRDLGSKTLRWDEVYTANLIARDNDGASVPVGSIINTRVDTLTDPIALSAYADTTAFDPATSGAIWGIGVDASGGFAGSTSIGWGLGGFGSYNIGDYAVYGTPFDTTFLAGWAGYFEGHVVANDYWVFSDRKFKSNITTMESSLDKIMALNPSTYNYKSGYGVNFDKNLHFGLLADEVEKVMPELVRESVTPTKRDPKTGERTSGGETFKSVNYIGLVPVLISAVQEQQSEIEAKNAEIADLTDRIQRLESAFTEATPDAKSLAGSNYSNLASLNQNSPNPFKEKTVISYNLPESTVNASIKVFSLSGEELKTVSLSGKGNGSVEISGGSFAAGTYTYQLVIDGKTVDTKIMVITK